MGRFIALPIARDPSEAEDQSVEVVQAQFPTWETRDADSMTLVLRSVANLYADVAELATRMGEEVFRYYGRGVANLPPVDETPAIGSVIVTAADANGPYVVPESLEIVGRGALGEPVGFRTVAAVVIPQGSTTVVADVEASEPGVEANGVSGAAEFSEYVDYLVAVEFTAPTSGGEDAEGDEAYLDRLGDELELMSPRPILPQHFAVLARRLGAYRATAIDGLNPNDDTTGNPAMVTVAGVDEAGNALAAALRASILEQLAAMREVGFGVWMIDPTYTPMDAAFSATAYPGWDEVAVQAAGIDALSDFFSPATYGQREDTGEDREWLNDPVIRYLEAAERLQRVEGLRYVDSLVIGKSGDTLGTSDVTMTGYAPLPTPGNVTGTVAPG